MYTCIFKEEFPFAGSSINTQALTINSTLNLVMKWREPGSHLTRFDGIEVSWKNGAALIYKEEFKTPNTLIDFFSINF